jgi:hypothetical protein
MCLRGAAKRIVSETAHRYAANSSAAIIFETEELSAMLGRDFRERTTLRGASAA